VTGGEEEKGRGKRIMGRTCRRFCWFFLLQAGARNKEEERKSLRETFLFFSSFSGPIHLGTYSKEGKKERRLSNAGMRAQPGLTHQTLTSSIAPRRGRKKEKELVSRKLWNCQPFPSISSSAQRKKKKFLPQANKEKDGKSPSLVPLQNVAYLA